MKISANPIPFDSIPPSWWASEDVDQVRLVCFLRCSSSRSSEGERTGGRDYGEATRRFHVVEIMLLTQRKQMFSESVLGLFPNGFTARQQTSTSVHIAISPAIVRLLDHFDHSKGFYNNKRFMNHKCFLWRLLWGNSIPSEFFESDKLTRTSSQEQSNNIETCSARNI